MLFAGSRNREGIVTPGAFRAPTALVQPRRSWISYQVA
jgi:hypothetical protein